MRLFIAAELPLEIRDALAETSACLRDAVSGRFVGPDLFHVTLAFLGDVSASKIARIEAVMERACAQYEPFDVVLGGLGTFGKPSRATLWQGFSDAGDLAPLARGIRDGLAADGFSFDAKAFRPHVTLMRNADVSGGEVPMPAMARGTIRTVTLFSSDLSGSRPVYEAVVRVVLGDGA